MIPVNILNFNNEENIKRTSNRIKKHQLKTNYSSPDSSPKTKKPQ
jgi:hypothetical protein